ncbi:hypothetical protein K7X08_036278 [Anisodus acutangulus]|uniref:DUF3444 domain-containing protein n=1 Tax=Anisodus acutangulus TaxID=402998 RepID=A0A9Q1L8K6_9SOLA|nr:hypothetical protein K7X08_036278 [Anisodus acutangulus]
MGTEDKTLFCFCHWGRKNKVLPDGSTSYVGGITRQVIAKTGIKYNDFVNAVFDRLCIDPSDKILHFTVKFDRSQLIQLSDQEDVNTLLIFNDDFAHVYASSLEKEPYSRLPSVDVKNVEPVVVSHPEPDTNPVRDDENDFASPMKKAQSNQSAGDSKPQQKEAVEGDDQKHAGVTRSCSNSVEKLNQNRVGLPEGDVQSDNFKVGTANGQASRVPSGGEKVELTVDSDSEPDTVPDSNLPEVYDYPDPEFSVFDKHKAQNRFAIDQIWACYDTADGMPRFYAHIRKVYSPEFKVMFSWLEAHPEDKRGRAWVTAELPVGCGKFRRGSTEYTADRLTFSHQVQCEMGKRGLYIVYPRKGETWALFKVWDIRWGSDPDNHRKYKYEIVEILSDYIVDVGVQVGYLDKVIRYVSLFQRTRLTEVGTVFVKPNELYKFSHRIPFKMTGTEREGVPAGSFELDPASLPLNPDDIWYPEKVMEDSRAANSEPVETVSPAVPPGTRDKSRKATTSLKSGDLNGIHATDGESSKVLIPPKEMNICKKKRTQMSSCSANVGCSTDIDNNCVKKSRYSSPRIPIHMSCQADRKLHSRTTSFVLSNSFGSSKKPSTSSDDKGFEEFFCDFKMDRSMGKFQVNQVWAVYGQNSTFPKTYALVKKIVPAPFKLHVVLLEACAGPNSAAQSVCGTFKVQNEKHQVYAPSSFSHVAKAVSINGNRFEIYPREGEIWALYKSLKKPGLDPDKFEYEIVEVIENSKDRIKVSSMVRVNGFKSVFRSPRKQRSNSVIFEIQKDGFWRFSHQIPAFQLSGEKGGVLRGCWELDPASVPCSLESGAPVIV